MESRNELLVVLVALSLLVVQQVLMSHVRLFGVHPEVLILGALCVAISGGPRRGAIAGFVAGLATDFYGSSTIGIAALSFTLVGWLIGRMIDGRPTAIAAGVAGFIGTAAALLVQVFLIHLVDGGHASVGHAVWVFIVAGLLNGVLAAAVAPRMVATWRARELSW